MREIWLDTLTASRWFFRSLKKGDWLWLVLAVVLASTTVTLVKQLGESVQQSMLRKASQSLGADFVIRSSRPIDKQWQQQAEKRGLQTTLTTSVVTMALSGDRFQLVRLKGIPEHYPLRGALTPTNDLPFSNLTTGQVWVEPKLVGLMALTPDKTLSLGELESSLAGSVQTQAVINPVAGVAPQVLMPLADFNRSGLVGPGSRVQYELAVAGTSDQVDVFAKAVQDENNPHWQTLSAQSPTEDLAKSLDTAWLFLDLSALSAVLVAGMSILIASRFYLNRWRNSMALMRAFGADNRKMIRLFALQLSWIAVFSSAIGVILGLLLFWLLTPVLADYFSPLVVSDFWPAVLVGFLSGILVLWSFAWQSFQTAVKTSPMRILKSVPQTSNGLTGLIGFGFLFLLISLMFGRQSVLWIIGGSIAVVVVLLAFAGLLLKVLLQVQHSSRGWFRIALSNLLKEPGLVRIQLISVGMVLFVLMLMTFVRQDLLQNWQASLPEKTPNTFIMNVQPDQRESVQAVLSQHDLHPKLAPMARGRLTAINKTPLLASEQESDRARRLLERESNIALLAQAPEYNQIIGQYSRPLAHPGVSVEEGMAELFGIQLGDVLTFNLAGQRFQYQVKTLRSVDWQSFRLNFFFILEPAENRDPPFSYIGNFYLPDNPNGGERPSSRLTRELAKSTPGVLLIDVKQIMRQIQDIMDQASWAVSWLYAFTLLASVAVLFTATLASQQSRVQGWLLLRTLGARHQDIVKIGLTEFALLGGVAGLLAATFAQMTSVLISLYLLKTEPVFTPSLWLLSLLTGVALLLVIGLVTQNSFLRKNPQALKHYLSHF